MMGPANRSNCSALLARGLELNGGISPILCGPGDYNDALYKELWDRCAGPLVTVPCCNERVYYFPQGHLEQLGALVHGELEQQMIPLIVPPKILCRIIYVSLMAEHETDQVCAKMVLYPEVDQTEITSPDPQLPAPQTGAIQSFHKALTASDIGSRNGLLIYQKHAKDCLPPLDLSQQPALQDLVATDLHRNKWHFRHIFRDFESLNFVHPMFENDNWSTKRVPRSGIICKPMRHLFTTGWSKFVTSKKLVAGDLFIFLRGENGRLHVGIRRLRRREMDIPSSCNSAENMYIFEILTSVSHALTTRSKFSVLYKPRISQSGFIVNVNKYLAAQKYTYSIGTRFLMRFEGELGLEQSFNGTIVGIEDASSKWVNSRWRCLKVKWDEPSKILRPERVSPWELESPVAFTPPKSLPLQMNKRTRTSHFRSHMDYGMWVFPPEPPSFSHYDMGSSSSFSSTSDLKTDSSGFSGNSSSQGSVSLNRMENDMESSALHENSGKKSLDAESDQHSAT